MQRGSWRRELCACSATTTRRRCSWKPEPAGQRECPPPTASKCWCRPAFPHGTARASRRPGHLATSVPRALCQVGVSDTLPRCGRLAGAREGQGPNEGCAMPDIVFVAIGLVAGLAVGWFLASSRSRPGMVKQLAETKVRGARAVEVMKQEVTVELARRDSELAEARTKLEHELHNVAKMQAEVKYAFDQKVQLGAELQAVVDERFREIGQLYEIRSTLEAAGPNGGTRVMAAPKRPPKMGVNSRGFRFGS